MLQVLLLVLALNGAPGSRDFNGPDPLPGPRPVTDKDVLAWSSGPPQCADWRQEQHAMDQRMKGLTEDCVIPPRKPHRQRDKLDQSQPHP
jgi:hypothetical protein